jgi:hypothetical protein
MRGNPPITISDEARKRAIASLERWRVRTERANGRT